MHTKARFPNVNPGQHLQPHSAAMAILGLLLFLLLILFFLMFTAQPVQGQTYRVIHYFSLADGAFPYAGLAIGKSGELYGTTEYGAGGNCTYYNYVGCGTVYRLSSRDTGWVLNPLHIFTGTPDGAYPGRITVGPNGTLYGTTGIGGGGAGVVFNLKPAPSACRTALCPWMETLLYSFRGGLDDAWGGGQLTFDQLGRLYGTSWNGGSHGGGAVYQLTPSQGGWTETGLYNFEVGTGGSGPVGTVTPDAAGNLYGMNSTNAAVFRLSPSETGWTKTVIHHFQNNDGCEPRGGLIFDQAGAIYGSMSLCGMKQGGTVFKLSPWGSGWFFQRLYDMPGRGPTTTNGNLVMDAAGNLYGTIMYGGQYDRGGVFKLTPTAQGWMYTSLHDFAGGAEDGAYPYDGVTLGADGKIYGTTPYGGLASCYDPDMVPGCGVVFEITP